MVQSVIQHSFHAGEWAPDLNARVDLAKYKSAAALLENYFVDYRGGASSRPGTKYVIRAYKSATPVRLIPFQVTSIAGGVLEFGDFYMRAHSLAAPVTDAGINITAVSGNSITATGNPYNVGDWVLINGVGGVTNINGKYFIVTVAGATFSVTDLFGATPSFTGYTTGGTSSRIFTLATPYAAADLALLKYTQLVNKLFLCHPNYAPTVLQYIAANNWTIGSIPFGATISVPTGITAVTTNAGTGNYTYVVTAVDQNGQESTPSSLGQTTINLTSGQNTTVNLSWTAVSGATSYNVYRTPMAIGAAVPVGAAFGFLMNVTATAAADSFISGSALNGADFSQGTQIPENPFQGAGVDHVTMTSDGGYTAAATATFSAAPSGGVTAIGQAVVGAVSVLSISASTIGVSVGQIGVFTVGGVNSPIGTTAIVTSVDGSGHVLTANILNPGSITSGSTPSNPIHFAISPTTSFDANVAWGVVAVSVISPGAGYTSAPTVTISTGTPTATATAVLQTSTAGNPAVPGLFQQRLCLAAKPQAVQTIDMSQTGSYYNFNISNPVQADDAMTLSLVSGQLNEIKSMVSVPSGLLLLTSRANWLVSSSTGAVSPIDVSAHAHSYNGASDVPPIIANFDILFVQNKNSIVRDLTFNFYTQIYTGTDISVLSSHLFYGFQILEWTWAEEPFKIVWAIRNDGTALSLTYLKEQELIGWSHSITNGLFKSVASATEIPSSGGLADSVYFVIQRTINGQTVQYIEHLAERIFPNGAASAWCVDAGLQYSGPPATSFSGAEHLTGQTVVGLADGVPITPFVMPATGSFTLPNPASTVTVGLAFTPKLQTLPLDIGEPTVQGKRKLINGVTVRVKDTLGLTIGKTFGGAQVPMKDLVVGNVGSASNGVVTGLVTGDARTLTDPTWDVPGQYCITQPNPLPVSILGVIPEIAVGDNAK